MNYFHRNWYYFIGFPITLDSNHSAALNDTSPRHSSHLTFDEYKRAEFQTELMTHFFIVSCYFRVSKNCSLNIWTRVDPSFWVLNNCFGTLYKTTVCINRTFFVFRLNNSACSWHQSSSDSIQYGFVHLPLFGLNLFISTFSNRK